MNCFFFQVKWFIHTKSMVVFVESAVLRDPLLINNPGFVQVLLVSLNQTEPGQRPARGPPDTSMLPANTYYQALQKDIKIDKTLNKFSSNSPFYKMDLID
jgi:hypothetical protein